MAARAHRPHHRLEPRYPLQSELRVRGAGHFEATYRARDVSLGGVFLHCSEPLDLFAEVRVLLPSIASQPSSGDGGSPVAVPARVMHVVSSARAAERGIQPGMGLQFEPTLPEQQAAVAAFVDVARRNDVRPRLPVPREGGDRAAAGADPILAYLLAAVDGERGPEELGTYLGLTLEQVEAALGELAQLGVIELKPRALSVLPPPLRSVPHEPSGQRREPRQPLAAELAPELRVDLLDRWSRIEELDHYQVLGVTRAAGRDEVRHAFFELSKRFHPDAHYRRARGEDLAKLERVFARMSEAYGVLGRPASRAEYDRYLDRKRALTRPQRTTASASVAGDTAALGVPALVSAAQTSERPTPAARQLWEAQRGKEQRRELLRALYAQAAYEEKHQRWAAAAETWRRICREDGGDAAAHRNAARALSHAGFPAADALEHAKRAVDLAPDDASNHRVLGQLYLAAGLKRKAREELEAALALRSSAPTVPAAPARAP